MKPNESSLIWPSGLVEPLDDIEGANNKYWGKATSTDLDQVKLLA